MTAVRRRELLRRLVDAPPVAEEERPAPEQPTPPTCAAGDPAFDYFGSFEACHTLLAEIRPLLDAEVRRLGIDTAGMTEWEIARQVFAFQQPPPATRAAPDRDAAGPADGGQGPVACTGQDPQKGRQT